MAEHVSDWPRVHAVVRPDATGEITTNGISRACAAESIDALRIGMIAHVVAIATTMRRPVRFDVAESDGTWPLAVRPTGIVQEVAPDGTIDLADGLLVSHGYCRGCRQPQPVTAVNCEHCDTQAPLRVEVEHVEPAPQVPLPAPQSIVTTLDDMVEITTRLDRGLRLQFDSDPAQIVPANIAVGRNPEPTGGRTAVLVENPSLQVSRTHALIDVDEEGRIIVTDANAGNGVAIITHALPSSDVAITEAETWLEPGAPTVVADGTKLLLGDVTLTVALVA